ncbi:MAG: phosphotransferase [Defluviitaleaceae bacterium]|nr:phosphotransferase [Defluviitaleaceae bacterium]
MDNIAEILLYWGLRDAAITPIASPSQSTWDINGKYILKKRNSTAEELSCSMQISDILASKNVPVAAYVKTISGQLISPDSMYFLMKKLSGETIDFYKHPNLAVTMGKELAKLHQALKLIESKIAYNENDLLATWKNKIKPSLKSLVSSNILENVDSAFSKNYVKLPRQLIHRDVHAHNVLFVDGKLTGWLDFDISQRNVRIFDIAYLLASLLFGQLCNFAKIKIWHEIYHNLLLGYNEVNPLTADEYNALPTIMIVIEFLFVWFWSEQENKEQSENSLKLAKWLYNEYFTEVVN